MSDLWSGSSYITDEEILAVNDRYCPIVEDISIDDDTLRDAVEAIESQVDNLQENPKFME